MERYLAERTVHIASAEPGVGAAQTLSAMSDLAVSTLAREAAARLKDRWAVVALGGWGSGSLLPMSDLDILVLSDAPVDRLKPFVEAVLYPLWDGGLKVGHQVRSPKQQLRAMRDDLQTCTAGITARPIAGDIGWATASIDSWVKDARRRSRRLLSGLQTRPRPGSPYLLEPDLKCGGGGRRDYDELVWASVLLGSRRESNLAGLVALDLLTEAELLVVEAAAAVLTTARWELQRAGLGDRMTVGSAEQLAAVDPEDVQKALAESALVLSKVRRRIQRSAERADETAPLSAEEVFDLLGAGEGSISQLEEAAQGGRLESLLPGFRSLMTCRRPGLGHDLTVGAHSVRAAALVAAPPIPDPTLARSLASLPDLRPLQVAVLAHDRGKLERGPGHAERGAGPGAEAARSFGLDADAAHLVGELVRLHLMLAETALHEDLDDEDNILRVASAIEDPRLLAPLHLLTAVDSAATGRARWTPWTADLVGTLVSRLDRALSPDVDGAGLVARGESVRELVVSTMRTQRPGELEFVAAAPLRYLASRDAAEVERDARLVAELAMAPSAVHALMAVSPGPVVGTHTVTVAAEDRPELLSRIAGAMSLSGLDILSVDAYGTDNKIALDTFLVSSATKRVVTTETFVTLERLLLAALRDHHGLATRLAERSRHYPSSAHGPKEVRIEQVGWTTALHLTAPNRQGLLHDVARAVSATGLDIRWARIQTIEGVAVDTFHLVGADGGPVHDPGTLGHVAMGVRAIL